MLKQFKRKGDSYEKQARTQETKEEIIQDKKVELLKKNIQQKQEKLKEEYMNLEITLLEEYIADLIIRLYLNNKIKREDDICKTQSRY